MSVSVAYSTDAVVDAMVASAGAEIDARNAVVTAETLFVDSAILTARSILFGLQAKDIAVTASARVKADATLSGLLYCSPASVGYHARTGRALLIDGDDGDVTLPVGMTAQGLQSLIKGLSVKIVDPILDLSVTTADAAEALVKAARKVAADKRAADKIADDKRAAEIVAESTPDGVETPDAETLAPVDYMRIALAAVLSATASGEPFDAEAETLSAEIVSLLSVVVVPVAA